MDASPKLGLYERVIDEALARQLTLLTQPVERGPLGPGEAGRRLAQAIQAYLLRALEGVPASDRPTVQVAICNRVLAALAERLPDFAEEGDRLTGELLRCIGPPRVRPSVSLSESALFINASKERRLGVELAREFESADAVDLICPFFLWTGYRQLRGSIRRHREAGRPLRVLTTTYRGVTQPRVLEDLVALGVEVRVSYDTENTRLHAKAWLFRRASGYSTAFVGSSNMSAAALSDGLEWNVRLSEVENHGVLTEFGTAFDNYWSQEEFKPYDPEEFAHGLKAERPSDRLRSVFAIHARPYQVDILDQLDVERTQHERTRNLVVAATGTGKTVIAALDYRNHCGTTRPSLLFVAHQQQILVASRDVFRHALGDGSFGELLVDGERPTVWRHVFASVQSLAHIDLERDWPADRFERVIIDEFHHASAANQTYARLLDHLQPKDLLGLTATPERTDGVSILHWFGGRIAAELRLWDAIDRGLLVPFQYFAVHDNTDLSRVQWRGGRYDAKALEAVYDGNTLRAHLVCSAVSTYVEDPRTMRALAFCAGVSHALYMTDAFNRAGLAAVAILGSTPRLEREHAMSALANGDLQVLVTVDVFNEGVDVPSIDTLLFLRPTESALLFTQQLGRGLRRSPTSKKRCLTVLDFVGHAHESFRYDRRFEVLTRQSRGRLKEAVQQGFPFLPAGCAIELDAVSREIVLENLQRGLGTQTRGLLEYLRSLQAAGDALSLGHFVREAELDLPQLYRGGRCYADLLHALGLVTPLPTHAAARRGLGRLIHVDDQRRLRVWTRLMRGERPRDLAEERVAMMLLAVVAPDRVGSVADGLAWLRSDPSWADELIQLAGVLDDQIDHTVIPFPLRPEVPLAVHCRYGLPEIMAAFGDVRDGRLNLPREGVFFDEPSQCNLLFITLEKDEDDYSPTTLYRDYALSPVRFHWQSQSRTRPSDKQGQRLIHHEAQGVTPLLFVRERRKDDRGERVPYLFLGAAHLASWVGERPMNVEWVLHHPMPNRMLRVAGAVAP